MQQWKLSPPFFVLVLLVRQIRANCYHYHHHHYCLPSHHLFTLNLFVIQEVSLLAILNYKWYLNDFKFHVHHVGTSGCQIHKLRFADDLNENM